MLKRFLILVVVAGILIPQQAFAQRQPMPRTAAEVRCTVPTAPRINITPHSDPVAYNFDMTSAQLSQLGSNTLNPYSPTADVTTGGMRHDKPKLEIEVKWGIQEYGYLGVSCLWYDEVNVKIHLKPTIYISKELRSKHRKCRDAIKEHELKHVTVDRQVINRHAQALGQAVLQAVNEAGAMGPYQTHQLQGAQKTLVQHIYSAIESRKLSLQNDMRREQGKVDSLQEYEYVGQFCQDALDRPARR